MINVLYSCEECGIKDRRVEMRARGKVEDIRDWMRDLTLRLQLDHGLQSPLCAVDELSEVKVPIPPGDQSRIGDPTAH